MIFLKVKNSYNKKLVTWLDLNLQVALKIIKIFLGTFLKKIYKVKKFYIYLTSLLYNSSTQEELI